MYKLYKPFLKIHVTCLSYSSDSLPNYQLSRCFLYWDGQCRMRTSTQISNNISRPLGNWLLDWTCTLCFEGPCESGNAFSSNSSHPPMFFHFLFQLFEWHVPSCRSFKSWPTKVWWKMCSTCFAKCWPSTSKSPFWHFGIHNLESSGRSSPKRPRRLKHQTSGWA